VKTADRVRKEPSLGQRHSPHSQRLPSNDMERTSLLLPPRLWSLPQPPLRADFLATVEALPLTQTRATATSARQLPTTAMLAAWKVSRGLELEPGLLPPRRILYLPPATYHRRKRPAVPPTTILS